MNNKLIFGLALMFISGAFAESYLGTIANIKIHGNYSSLPAGTAEVFISGMNFAPRINKDDPAKKETLSLLLTAKSIGTKVWVETTGVGPGSEIRNVSFE